MCISKKNINFNVNYNIKFDFVRLLDEENSNMNKIIRLQDAIYLATKRKLDLVQINFDGKWPVCKILDFNKFLYKKYKLYKEERKKKKKNIFKEIYVRPNISISDLNIKIKKIISFLINNLKVKVIVKFIGREISYPKLGFDLLKKISYVLCEKETISSIFSMSDKIENKQLNIIYIPKK